MCFGKTPKYEPKVDQSLEAAKFAESQRNVDRLADEKEEDTRRQRGLIYGLFGPRSFLQTSGAPSSMLRPVGT